MLRTLGLKNVNLIVILFLQSLMFAIPGLILGFLINFILVNGAQIALMYFVEYATVINIKERTIYLGLSMGILLPIFSNILPMK